MNLGGQKVPNEQYCYTACPSLLVVLVQAGSLCGTSKQMYAAINNTTSKQEIPLYDMI